MFLRAKPSLQESLVVLLAEEANITALQLQERIASRLKRVSIQAIYQELRLLQTRGAVVKAGELFSLSLPWVLRMITFGDILGRNYIRGRAAAIPLPKEGEERVWHFSSLRRLENFWVHLLLVLIESTENKILFQWSPQPWYYLVQQQRQVDFQDAVEKLGVHIYKIVGGRSFLDLAFLKYHRASVYTVSSARSPFESRRSLYISIIGNYLLKIHFDPRTTRKIDEYFLKVRSEVDLSIPEILQLMARPVSISVRLYQNARKVAAFRKDFCRFFKLDVKDVLD